jgi:hypothetical protein
MDAKYSEGVPFAAFDISLIKEFLNYGGYGATALVMIDHLKNFVEYLETKRRNTFKVPLRENGRSNFVIRAGSMAGANNTIFLEGTEQPKPIIEACKLRPVFRIYKGTFFVVRNFIIQYVGTPKNIVRELYGPSFVFDPGNVIFEEVEHCARNPDNWVIDHAIGIGGPKRYLKNHSKVPRKRQR